ncbi:hypothetical protein GBA52_028919 [Prunus armeniaca]|nr:hypothetical protein GBA52_028919 [Prunus armeniaca]
MVTILTATSMDFGSMATATDIGSTAIATDTGSIVAMAATENGDMVLLRLVWRLVLAAIDDFAELSMISTKFLFIYLRVKVKDKLGPVIETKLQAFYWISNWKASHQSDFTEAHGPILHAALEHFLEVLAKVEKMLY